MSNNDYSFILDAYNEAIKEFQELKKFTTDVFLKRTKEPSNLVKFIEKNQELKPIGIYLGKLKEKDPDLADFAFLDYKLFPKYYNAIYIILNDNKADEFLKYAECLSALYDTEKEKAVSQYIFDSNKVIQKSGTFEPFIISKKKVKKLPHEFFVDFTIIKNYKNIQNIKDNADKTIADKIKAIYNIYKNQSNEQRLDESIKKVLQSCKSGEVVGGIEFKNPRAAFFTYLHFISMITPSDWEQYIYYPATIITTDGKIEWIGGLLLAYNRTTSIVERLHYKQTANSLVSSIYSQSIYKALYESYKHSVVAGIMARNLSHNIGSHVLASIEKSDIEKKAEQVKEFFAYLQNRMNFLARVGVEKPPCGEPMYFIRDLLHGFFKQDFLLNYLIADQGGWRKDKIKFYVCLPDRNALFFKYDNKEAWVCNKKNYKDFLVSIPDGTIGAQAFYAFMEGMMRNSAKYGENRDIESYIITIYVENKGQYYKLAICDNLSVCNENNKLAPDIQNKIKDSLSIDKDGKLITHYLGIAEMKEACDYLIKPYNYPAKTEDSETYPLWVDCLSAQNCPGTNEAQSRNLCNNFNICNNKLVYTFNLAKPQMVAIVNSPDQLPAGSEKIGIRKFDSGKDNKETVDLRNFQFVLIYAENKDKIISFIKDNHKFLPPRILVVDDDGFSEDKIYPKRRAVICKSQQIKFDNCEQLILSVYEAWIKNRWIKDREKIDFYLAFNRDDVFFEPWYKQLRETEVLKDVVNLYLIKILRNGETIKAKTKFKREASKYVGPETQSRKILMYDSHGDLAKTNTFTDQSTYFYHLTGSEAKKIFETLSMPPQDKFAFNYFLLGLIEAALAKILIVDERVAISSMHYHDTWGGNCEHLIRLNKALCYPILKINDKYITKNTMLKFKQVKNVCEVNETKYKINIHNSSTSFEDGKDIDFIIVHYGLIETLPEIKIDTFYDIASNVIIVSGRSLLAIKDKEIQKMPFLEYPILQDNCYPSLSKYHMVRALMSLVGEIIYE